MFVLVALVAIVPAMRVMGVETGNIGLRPAIAAWMFGAGLRALLITGAALVIVHFLGVVVGRLEERIGST